MAENPYTDRELSDAEDFLRRRIESEVSMQNDVADLLAIYAAMLLQLWYRGASAEEVNALVDELIEQLIDDCYILGVDDRDGRRSAIMLWMNSERGGDTMEGRIQKRVNTFIIELGAVYIAARMLGIAQERALQSVRDNFKHPWDNPILEEVREKIVLGELAGDIGQFTEPHFGQGVEISSYGALQKITAYHVADAWMWWQYEEARDNGATGYYVVRGSDYPCDECDSHTGIFYPMDDEMNRPQYHMNCCCIVVYTYTDRL